LDGSTIEMVWNKAVIVPGWNPMLYRKDACGAVICRSAYGTIADTGWEIDHVIPVARGERPARQSSASPMA
jgi:hypothetical protein